ncbi:MAG: entericidin A/B family lipoprotein [Phycisphaerales bacterium]|nr:MAG: entericidin A/B family lipoprotein [Phycisphaerales bacterium]
MKTRICITAITMLGMVVWMFSITGCNTWKGVGKDVERTGEAMQGDE